MRIVRLANFVAPQSGGGRRKVLGRTWPALTDELIGHYAEVTGRTRQAKVAI